MPINKYRKNQKFIETAFIYESRTNNSSDGQVCKENVLVLTAPAMVENKRTGNLVSNTDYATDAPATTRITIRHDFDTNIQFNSSQIIGVRNRQYKVVGIYEDDINRVVKFDVNRRE